MSVRARIDPDFDPSDFDQDNDFDEAERKAKRRRWDYDRQRWDQEDDEDEDAKEARRKKENEQRKQIRRIAEQMAQSKGGSVDEWIFLLTPRGRPFSDVHIIGMGYSLAATFTYTSVSGNVLYQSLRYEHKSNKKEKTFVLRQPACPWDKGSCPRPNDIHYWTKGKPFAVVYRWHDIAAKPGERVIVCEGEGNADCVCKLGLLATTVAGQKWSENAAEMLADRDLVVLEDNDEPGRFNTEKAIAVLAPVAKSIRVVRLPGLKHRKDVVDWIDAGHTREEFEAVVDSAPANGLTEINVVGLKGKDVPIQRWAIEDRVPLGHVTLLSGHGGAGKSTLLLHQSVAHVLAKQWLGFTALPGPALFLDAEDDEGIIHKRLDAILRHYGADYDQLGGLHVHSLLGADAVLAAPNFKSGRIEPTTLYRQLLAMARDIRPVLISISSSADVFAGNEIDRGQVRQFVALLTAVAMAGNSAVILNSHPSVAGMATNSGISGSTAWHNSVRARIYLNGVKENEKGGEPTTDWRVLEFRKNNYGPVSSLIVLQYQNGLFLPVEGADASMAERNQKAEEVYLEVLQLLVSQGQVLSASKRGGEYAAAKIHAHPLAKDFLELEMEKAQQRLLDANKIHIVKEGPPSKPRARIVPGPRPDNEPL